MPSDLYIIAAGLGSRMNSSIPKALVPITGEPCLTTTLQQIGHKFRKVFVVTNVKVQRAWDNYFSDLQKNYPELNLNLYNLPITSGLGDGHAVLEALHVVQKIDKHYSNDVVIAWGDVFFPQEEIIDELLAHPMHGSGLIPSVHEAEPYVQLEVVQAFRENDDLFMCTGAKFSKHGEQTSAGFHDQSVFRFNAGVLYRALSELNAAFWKGDRYITPGGELSLLHTFHYLSNIKHWVYAYRTDYPTLSFNTVEEVYNVQLQIDSKWKHKFRSQS